VIAAGCPAAQKVASPALAIDSHIAALAEDGTGVRLSAAKALAASDDPRARGALLLHALADPEWEVQMIAAKALGRSGDPDIFPALMEGLEGDDRQRRIGSALALAHSPDPRAFDALGEQCRKRNFAFRWLVGEAIGRANNLRFKDQLLAALSRGDDWRVQEVAAVALAEMHPAVGIQPLLAALKSKDPYVRKITCWHLGRIGDPRAVQPLIDDILKKYDTYALRVWGHADGGIRLIARQLDAECEARARQASKTNFAAKELKEFEQWWAANKHRYIKGD